MAKCGDCFHYPVCQQFVDPDETFPEVKKGCPAFKDKADYPRIVRCKDCRWAEDFNDNFLQDVFVAGAKNCRIKRGDDAYGYDLSVISPNDFCSDGEWREGE